MFSRVTRNFIIILLFPFLLSSCIETAAISTFSSVYLLKKNSFKKSISDTRIVADITQKLTFNKKRSEYKNIYVNVNYGRVLISGYVKNKDVLSNAKEIIWKVKGVKEVMSEISIKKVKRNYLYDTLLASQIKTKLMLDKKIKALDINVEVYNKEVYLMGHVSSREEVRYAAQVSSKVLGVKKVVSYLRVNILS